MWDLWNRSTYLSRLSGFSQCSTSPNIYYGYCEYCRTGRVQLCDHLSAIGVTRDGGMAEYCVVPEANCYLLPDSLSFEMGALIEPLGCVLHGIQQLQVWPGASVLIIGGGYIGQLMLQVAKLYGAFPVSLSEPERTKRDLAAVILAKKGGQVLLFGVSCLGLKYKYRHL